MGSRTYSLKLEGFENHTNVYVGEFDSDVPYQHFKRLRDHKTSKNNPDYIFITHFISDKALNRCVKRLEMFQGAYKNKKLKIPERYKQAVKTALLNRIDGAMLSMERISYEMGEQMKVVFDEEIVLKSREVIKRPLEFDDIFSGRYLRGISEMENDVKIRVVYCRLNCPEKEIECERCRGDVERIIERYMGGKNVVKWIKNMVNKCYREVDVEMKKIITEKGERRMRRYYGKINPYMWHSERWVEALFRNIKDENRSVYYKMIKIKEARVRYLDTSADRAKLLLIYRMEKGEDGYPDDFYDPILIPLLEHYLSICKNINTVKDGDYFYTDETENDKGISGLSMVLGFDAISRAERRLSVYRLLFRMERLARIERKNGKFATKWRIIEKRSIENNLDEELLKHKLVMIKSHVSKCGRHIPRITQCRETGEIYDENKCMIFKDDKEWRDYEESNRNLGKKMECLIEFIKRESKTFQLLLARAQDRSEKRVKDTLIERGINIEIIEPPPDG